MAHSLNDIARTRFTLGADHRSTLSDTAQGLTQVFSTTDERNLELRLVDMVDVISWAQYLTLIDVVDVDSLQDLCLSDMSDTAFCHDRDRYSLLDTLDHLRVAHTCYATGSTDISRDTLQCHDGTCAGFLCDLCLFRRRNIHNHTALEHLC